MWETILRSNPSTLYSAHSVTKGQVLDIPIVLPPLVIGISLLIFFQTGIGKAIESIVPVTYAVPSVILAQFMEKKVVQAVKLFLLPAAFGKIGSQNGAELPFVQDIDQADLGKAVLDLGGGDAQVRGAGAGDKLQYYVFHGK